MCNIHNADEYNCHNATDAFKQMILETLREMAKENREKLKTTTGETRAIRLMGTIIGLEDSINLIESFD